MHEPRETSYYEIALTNRQVVVFFVVLLVCVVGAFFSGVWLGQRRAADQPRIAQLEAADEPAESTEPLEELNFFTDDPGTSRSRGKRALEPAGSPETTLLDDVRGAERSTVESPSVEPQSIEPQSIESQSVETESVEPVRSAPQAGESRRISPAEPVAEREPLGEPQPAAAADGYVIQVFSSPDGGQARKLLDRLVVGGYEAFLSPVEVEGRTMYRVRLGPLDSRSAADRLAAEVGKAYQLDTWITRND